jgi:prepilin-type N-terminal cleavage/methylation domain-containing protein/prepilin-type processing-associated H-X9-DG protein
MKKGFTIIEMLVVMAILLVLSGILVPVIGSVMERAKTTQCLSNLRTMAQAVSLYQVEHQGKFPPALVSGGAVTQGWDFFITGQGSDAKVEPGWIWQEYGHNKILQCPSFHGPDNWAGEPYTGYNYNASYLGGMRTERRGRVILDVPSSRLFQVRNPSETAMFGDGEYGGGANKFMRSPLPGKLDPTFSGREGGTQGHRHNGNTNVAFVDGHVKTLEPIDPTTCVLKAAEGTGFLSPDNSLYDLD